LNIYDTKSLSCAICGTAIGEVAYDAEIIRPKCGQCSLLIQKTKCLT